MARKDEIFNLEIKADTRDVDRVTDALDAYSEAAAGVGEKAKRSAPETDRASDSLSKMADAAIVAQASLGALNAAFSPLAGFAGDVVGELLQQESAMNRVARATGTTGDQLAEIESTIERLYTSGLGESFDDVALAVTEVRNQTKLTGPALDTFTRNALLLSDTFDYDVAESTRAAMAAMDEFGISGDQAFDLIATTAQLTGDPMDDLLDTVNEYAPIFADAGYSAEDMFNQLAQGSNAGAFNLDKVADLVKEFNIRMTDSNTATRDAVKQLSVLAGDELFAGFGERIDTVDEFFGAIEDGSLDGRLAADRVSEALKSIQDPILRNTLAVAIMGTAYEDLGADAALAALDIQDELNPAIADAGGTMDAMAATIQGDPLKALDSLNRTFKQLFIDVLQPFVPVLTDNVIPALQKFGTWFSTLDISGGLAAWNDVYTMGKQIGVELMDMIKENLAPEVLLEKVGAFGSNLLSALTSNFPEDWGQWAMDTIVTPFMNALQAFPGMVATALNNAIPDNINFPIRIPNPAPFGDAYLFDGAIDIPLPPNPIPIPGGGADAGNYASGGSFIFGGGGVPMLGSTDEKVAIGLTPGERVDITPAGASGGSGVQRVEIPVMLDGKQIYRAIVELNGNMANPRLARG